MVPPTLKAEIIAIKAIKRPLKGDLADIKDRK